MGRRHPSSTPHTSGVVTSPEPDSSSNPSRFRHFFGEDHESDQPHH